MTDKPQTLAEQIRATYPPLMTPDQRVAWDGAISRAAALADAATPTGWVIANGNNNRWRCVWEWESNAEWTDDIAQALKFATRDDAERYSKEDEDAWLIYQVGIPPAEQAGAVGREVRVKPLVWRCVGWSSGDGVRGENDDTWEAYAASDESPYVIEWHGGDNFLITPSVGPNLKASTLPGAKAAANADYVARITSALEPDPTPALGWRAMQTAAANVARNACLVPPDGGSPTADEVAVCDEAERRILALPGPTDAQALAEAVRLLSRDALMVENIDAVADACREFKIKPELFRAALAKIGEAK